MIGAWDYYYLVGGFKHVLFSIIYGIVHPIDWDGLLLGEYIYIYTAWWFGTMEWIITFHILG